MNFRILDRNRRKEVFWIVFGAFNGRHEAAVAVLQIRNKTQEKLIDVDSTRDVETPV